MIDEKILTLLIKIKSKLPLIVLIIIGLFSFYLTLKGVLNYIFLTIGQFTKDIPDFSIFGNPIKPSIFSFIGTTFFLIVGWLISTKRFQSPKWRKIWFFNMFLGILFHYLWMVSAYVNNYVLPALTKQIHLLDYNNNIWIQVLIRNSKNLLLAVYFAPSIIVMSILNWILEQYHLYSEKIREEFLEFEFKNPFLQKWFRIENTENWPDVVLGPDIQTNELIIQNGKDRTLNNIIVGGIGTGKTSALVLPIINQDLHWITRYINDFPKIFRRDDYNSIKKMYLNGISIIEPSNDLCQQAYQLVKAHNIPDEMIFYIDPTNENTPSINPMQGPVEKVAEAFATVMEGLAEGKESNFFFQQSERNHLKNYIYLLKLHDPQKEVTFDMLLRMYDNPNYAHEMHEQLKQTYPPNLDEITDRDEQNHWAIVRQIDEWFDTNLRPKVDGKTGVPKRITYGEYRGKIEYYDAKAEYVQGLRNVLNDIGASPLIRRVLFGKSSFDFDRHMEIGGVLLVNTAKGELGQLSNVLGKLILLSLQNAVFRRKPMVSTFHHIIVDEFPDYIYRSFKEFPAQSRKYKAIITVVAQTVSQLADKYGETYMQTLLGTLRHKMVYGDIPYYDAQLFSNIFGEKNEYEESISEQNVNALQENPMQRTGNQFTGKDKPILSPSDIIYQNAFECAVKIVKNNRPIPVRQIRANFVNKDEFEEAIVKVKSDSAEFWKEESKKMNSKAVSYVKEYTVEQEEPQSTFTNPTSISEMDLNQLVNHQENIMGAGDIEDSEKNNLFSVRSEDTTSLDTHISQLTNEQKKLLQNLEAELNKVDSEDNSGIKTSKEHASEKKEKVKDSSNDKMAKEKEDILTQFFDI